MPIHSFEDPQSGETLDIYVPASAPTEQHSQQIVNGRVYKRVYAAPLAARDLGLGDCTKSDYARKTDGKRGLKVGDMWEISAEMSDRRRQRDGVDGVREQMYKRHEEEFGEKHPDVARREAAEKANRELAEWGVRINV